MSVVEFRDLSRNASDELLSAYGLELITLTLDAEIPASYWGAPEAGIAGQCVFVRADTPAHSLLHDAGLSGRSLFNVDFDERGRAWIASANRLASARSAVFVSIQRMSAKGAAPSDLAIA